MKKVNKLLLLLLVAFAFSIGKVQAAEKLATCKYTAQSGAYNISFDVTLNDDGTVSRTPDSGQLYSEVNKFAYYYKSFNEYFKDSIYPDGKLSKTCPVVYVCDVEQQFGVYTAGVACATGSTAIGINGTLTYVSDKVEKSTAEKKVYCSKRKTLRNSSSYDARVEFIKDTDGKNKFSVYKVYKKDNSEELMGTVEQTGIVMIDLFNIRLGSNSDVYFSDKCDSTKMYFRTTDGTSLYVEQTQPEDSENGSYAVTKTDEDTGEDLNKPTTPKEDDSEKYYTGCPLGEDVTKDLYGLLKIVKILAPILVIGLTILEFVRSIAKGEIDGEAKKLGIRFVKRLIIAVILFFLPVLVNQVMIMANIWDENGTCDFSKSATETISSSTSTSGYVNTYAKCETRNESENMCLSAPSNKCYWDDTLEDGNKCQYRNKSDKCDEKCSPTHLKETDKYNVCFDACMNK